MSAQKKKKPISRKAKRAAARREPLLIENPKQCMFIRGHKTSTLVMEAVAGLRALKKPYCVTLSHKNNILPFEDETSLEFLAQKNDCSLFVLGSHSKKRPNNLVLGRLFNYKILDMVEVGVTNFKSLSDFAQEGCSQPAAGSKPCLMFSGPAWEASESLGIVRNLLADMFRGPVVDIINLAGVDHVLVFSVNPSDESCVYVRHYHVAFRKSGTKIPKVQLEECGPRMDWEIRRTQFAESDARKQAMKVPKQVAKRGTSAKNVSTNVFRDTVGTVHMDRQQLQDLALAKPRGLKGGQKRKTAADGNPAPKPKSSKK